MPHGRAGIGVRRDRRRFGSVPTPKSRSALRKFLAALGVFLLAAAGAAAAQPLDLCDPRTLDQLRASPGVAQLEDELRRELARRPLNPVSQTLLPWPPKRRDWNVRGS
jgi:hypothetical protein